MFKSKAKALKKKLIQSFGQVKDSAFYFEHIDKYFRNNTHQNSYQTISDKTVADLDFEELFMFLDRTHSNVGQQYLYNQLRNPFVDSEKVKMREELISLFMKNEALRLKVQLQLEALNISDAYFIASLFQEKPLEPPKWHRYLKLLALLPLLFLLLISSSEIFVYLLTFSLVVNLAIHYKNKLNLFQYLSSVTQLIVLLKKTDFLSEMKEFEVINPRIRDDLNQLKKVKLKILFFTADAKLENDLYTFIWGFIELIKVPFLIEPLLLFNVLKSLQKQKKALKRVFDYLGEIDLIISIASLRKGLQNFCLPEIVDDRNLMQFKKLYHPLIVNCVTNNLAIGSQSILLTGSNMSGKTSFIRTVGINTLTAFTINTCFGEFFKVPKIRIFSAIRITDDLMNDKSYYFEEVLTIKEMIEAAKSDESNLFLLDEIFKGTNTVERIAAGKAVLSRLALANNVVFVSTHDIELADLLANEYDLYHFSEIIDKNNVGFDYQLKSGKLTNRNAIRILEINGYPEKVILEAKSLASKLDVKRI